MQRLAAAAEERYFRAVNARQFEAVHGHGHVGESINPFLSSVNMNVLRSPLKFPDLWCEGVKTFSNSASRLKNRHVLCFVPFVAESESDSDDPCWEEEKEEEKKHGNGFMRTEIFMLISGSCCCILRCTCRCFPRTSQNFLTHNFLPATAGADLHLRQLRNASRDYDLHSCIIETALREGGRGRRRSRSIV